MIKSCINCIWGVGVIEVGCGWSVSPEQVWKDANVYYNKYIVKEND